jgi:hypothetical protein
MSPATSEKAERGVGAALAACVAVFVILRILICLAAPTQLYHAEEYVNLRLAAAVLGDEGAWPDGYVPPPGEADFGSLFDYQYQDWDGGTLVVGVVLVPLVALLGLSTAAVKAGATLWALAGMLAWVAVLGRLFGRTGALVAAVLFVAAPAPWLLLSSIHWGNHAESALFPPLLLLLLHVAAERERPREAAAWLFGAGVLAGFGCWFSLLNMLPVALCLLFAPLLLGWRTLAAAPVFVAGGAIGFLPWLGRNRKAEMALEAQGVRLFEVLGSGVGERSGGQVRSVPGVWPRYADWELHGLWSPDGVLRELLDGVPRYGAVVGAILAIAGAFWLLWRRPGDPDGRAAARLYVTLACLGAYLLLPMLLDRAGLLLDRRVAPAYPLGLALIALGVCTLLANAPAAWRCRIAFVLLAALAAPGLIGQLGLITSWDRPEKPIEPWLWYSPPTTPVRDRVQAGVPGLEARHADEIDRIVRELLTAPGQANQDGIRGLGRAMVDLGGPWGTGALLRFPLDCPSVEQAAPMGFDWILQPGEARGFAAGLSLRCGDRLERIDLLCDQLRSLELQAACRSGIPDTVRSEQGP